MQKIICTYTDQLVPLAARITTELVETFNQVMKGGSEGGERGKVRRIPGERQLEENSEGEEREMEEWSKEREKVIFLRARYVQIGWRKWS